jgi:pSer/pThr/pTyr-binding forkhead associated (FHA) protein
VNTPAPLGAEVWFLDQISGPGTVREYRIAILPWTIGRAAECNLTLRSNSVSKEHARIERGVEGLKIVDLGSTNGTHLNGQPVSGALALSKRRHPERRGVSVQPARRECGRGCGPICRGIARHSGYDARVGSLGGRDALIL